MPKTSLYSVPGYPCHAVPVSTRICPFQMRMYFPHALSRPRLVLCPAAAKAAKKPRPRKPEPTSEAAVCAVARVSPYATNPPACGTPRCRTCRAIHGCALPEGEVPLPGHPGLFQFDSGCPVAWWTGCPVHLPPLGLPRAPSLPPPRAQRSPLMPRLASGPRRPPSLQTPQPV